MNVNITARKFKAREDIKDFIHEKVAKLRTFHDGIREADVIMSLENDDKNVEIILHTDSKNFIINERTKDMFKSVELATDRMQVQLKRHKGKQNKIDHDKVSSHIIQE